ncbi:MAG: hypothetical protein IT307_05915 [Chloroflexi bacterium]|nr:hypothetical protein [Chloroflexota bacterium]
MPDAITVRGPIAPDQLGVTMTHTHVLFDLTPIFVMPDEASRRGLALAPLALENLGAIRRDAVANRDNLQHLDVDAAIREVSRFKQLGGGTLVEVSPRGLARDPIGLLQVSNATGVNLVCCTGLYVGLSHPPFVPRSSVDELAAMMVADLTRGIGETGIRAGVIKIAMGNGQGRPFVDDNEEKAFRAAIRAHAETNAALVIHPSRPYTDRHWDTYFDLVQQNGGKLEKCVASHVEFIARDVDYQKSLLNRGANLAYDQFGGEEYSASRGPAFDAGYPSDRERLLGVSALVHAGYAGQVVLSNEVAFKTNYESFGGQGYGHILRNIVPELRALGATTEQIETMLIANPARLLPF